MVGVILLKKNGFYICVNHKAPCLHCEFPETIVKDLEVLDGEQLHHTITEFIEQNKIPNFDEGYVLLSPAVYFEKIVTTQENQLNDATVEEFKNNVPLNNTYSHIYSVSDGKKIIVVNSDILDCLRIVFEKKNSKVSYAVPTFMIDPNFPEQLDESLAQSTEKKVPIIKDQGMPLVQEVFIPSTVLIAPPEKSNKLLIIGGGIFIVIGLIGSVFMLIKQSNDVKKLSQKTPTASSSPAPTLSVSLAPTIAPASPSATISLVAKSTIKIQILNGSGTPGQAEILRRALIKDGFTNVTTGNASSINAEKTLIAFNAPVPLNVRAEVIKIVKGNFSENISEKEVKTDNTDIIITTARISPTPNTLR